MRLLWHPFLLAVHRGCCECMCNAAVLLIGWVFRTVPIYCFGALTACSLLCHYCKTEGLTAGVPDCSMLCLMTLGGRCAKLHPVWLLAAPMHYLVPPWHCPVQLAEGCEVQQTATTTHPTPTGPRVAARDRERITSAAQPKPNESPNEAQARQVGGNVRVPVRAHWLLTCI